MKSVDRLRNELVSRSGRDTCARMHPRKQKILFLNLYHFRPPSIQLPTYKVEGAHHPHAKRTEVAVLMLTRREENC